MKKLFAILFAVTFMSSCSLNQYYHFNEDFSGNYKMEFDLSAVMDMAKAEDPEAADKDMWADLPMDSIEGVLNAIDGIENAKFSGEDGVMKVTYDFKNLESLNLALDNTNFNDGEEGGEDEMFGSIMGKSTNFELKGKNKLIYNSPSLAEMGMADSLTTYMEMLDYNMEFNFAKNVKSVDNQKALISADGKSVVLEGNFGELMKGEKELAFEVKLK